MNGSEQLESEEALLILRAANMDLEAFNQLVLKYQNLIYNQAYALLGDHYTAEDVTQESFIKAFENMNKFRGGSFRSWMFKIVIHSCYDRLRRAKRHPNIPLYPVNEDGEEIEDPVWLADPNSSVQDIVEQKEFSRALFQYLDTLPESYRTVLTLIDFNGFDYTETAQILHIPIGTVKSRLARARLHMQEMLKSNPNHKDRLAGVQTGIAA